MTLGTTSAGSRDGFTLVEILMALLLLGLAMTPLLRMYSESMSTLLAADDLSVALSLAEREMERVRAEGPDEAALRRHGDAWIPEAGRPPEQTGGRSWRIRRRVVPERDPLEVHVEVFRVAPGSRRPPVGEVPTAQLATLVEGTGL